MRSKCRCSCVLQFTLCHAFSCVLHRPPSQLIHCIMLFMLFRTSLKMREKKIKFHKAFPGRGMSTEPRSEPTQPRVDSLRAAAQFPTLPASSGRVAGTGSLRNARADKPSVQGTRSEERATRPSQSLLRELRTFNDPSAGSPTETLLRLLLPLNATVWTSFR